MVTRSWFLAAARTIAGPPMSMFSIASSNVQPGLRDRRRERIEVHHHQVDGLDAVLGHHRVVGAAPAEQAAVDLRVQRLDAAVHDLGEAGDAETSVTSMPSSRSSAAVPPVERSSTPRLRSARAKSSRPSLFETLSSARRMVALTVEIPAARGQAEMP